MNFTVKTRADLSVNWIYTSALSSWTDEKWAGYPAPHLFVGLCLTVILP